eukprot:TRINITY_DN5483_c0_g1_i9.p1 TRINITY_DN5483_c0_g1~~TRINITY_DN5483_c0_g1_i9.p1  ORF type:complete len:466 (+),score=82.90 TRINITY_DN5483_c0_g1_i9:57-1454(+)
MSLIPAIVSKRRSTVVGLTVKQDDTHAEIAKDIDKLVSVLRRAYSAGSKKKKSGKERGSPDASKATARTMIRNRIASLRGNEERRSSLEKRVAQYQAERKEAEAAEPKRNDIVQRNIDFVTGWKEYQKEVLGYRAQMQEYTTKKREMLQDLDEVATSPSSFSPTPPRASRASLRTISVTSLRPHSPRTVNSQQAPAQAWAAIVTFLTATRNMQQITTNQRRLSVSHSVSKNHSTNVIKSFLAKGLTTPVLFQFYARRYFQRIRQLLAHLRGCLKLRKARVLLWSLQWEKALQEKQRQVKIRNESTLRDLQPLYKHSNLFRPKLDQKAVAKNGEVFKQLNQVPGVPADIRDQVLANVYTKKRWEYVKERRRWEAIRRKNMTKHTTLIALGLSRSRYRHDSAPPSFRALLSPEELEEHITTTINGLRLTHQRSLRIALSSGSSLIPTKPLENLLLSPKPARRRLPML